MIDIHAHLLPQVDDGPDSWEESLAIIRKGIADGIKGVVCTSHVLNQLDEELEREFIDKFEELKQRAGEANLKISLWLGSEIHCNAEFNPKSKIATLNNNGKYALLELPLIGIPNDVEEVFFRLSIEGITTILAHPERNNIIAEKLEMAYNFIEKGVLLQANAGSVTGQFGKHIKHTVFEMLDHKMIHFIASDCHSPHRRPMVLSQAYKIINRHYGEKTAKELFVVNPYKAVIGEKISPSPPIPIHGNRVKRKRTHILKIFRRQ